MTRSSSIGQGHCGLRTCYDDDDDDDDDDVSVDTPSREC